MKSGKKAGILILMGAAAVFMVSRLGKQAPAAALPAAAPPGSEGLDEMALELLDEELNGNGVIEPAVECEGYLIDENGVITITICGGAG